MVNGDRAVQLEWQLDEAQRITHVGSWSWDTATDTVVWSDELYRIVGIEERAPITPRSYEERVHPEDRARVRAVVGNALAARERFSMRVRIVRPDGIQRDVEMIGEPTLDAEARVVGLIGTSRDITEELRREQTIRLYSDIVNGLAIGLSIWRPDAAGVLHLAAANPATERLIGITLPEQLGATLSDCFPAASELSGVLHGIDAEHPRRELAACRLAHLPGAPTFAVKAFALPDRCVGLTLEDITQRVRDQRLHFAERRALEMLSASAPLDDILSTIVHVIEELAPGVLASALLVDQTGTVLVSSAGPSLPAALRQGVIPIGPSSGSCGTAAFRRDAVFTPDIATDPLWDVMRPAVLPLGLRACWSLPILANDGRVLGTFGMFYREPRMPDPTDVELISRAVHVAGIAIERRRLDELLLAGAERSEHGDINGVGRRV